MVILVESLLGQPLVFRPVAWDVSPATQQYALMFVWSSIFTVSAVWMGLDFYDKWRKRGPRG